MYIHVQQNTPQILYMIYWLFQIPYNTPHYRRLKSEQLKADLSSALYDEIQVDIRIYIYRPTKESWSQGLWYNVYTCTTEYTTNHIQLVVYRHHTTGELWYNVYTTEYTTHHNPLVVYSHLTTCGLWYNVYTCTTEYIYNTWIVICGFFPLCILCFIYDLLIISDTL
jgi:hypothetical protein